MSLWTRKVKKRRYFTKRPYKRVPFFSLTKGISSAIFPYILRPGTEKAFFKELFQGNVRHWTMTGIIFLCLDETGNLAGYPKTAIETGIIAD
jgi:hypothetical protein